MLSVNNSSAVWSDAQTHQCVDQQLLQLVTQVSPYYFIDSLNQSISQSISRSGFLSCLNDKN